MDEAASPTAPSKSGLSALERNILAAKGASPAHIEAVTDAGVRCRADFVTIGNAATLVELTGMPPDVAENVMTWALATTTAQAQAPPHPQVVVEAADVVHCVHCKARQPKDYNAGDLCPACGRQAEPTFSCYWCSASGPGKFCRSCAAEFVPVGEIELALVLKRDGKAKDEIPRALAQMSASEKEALWGRVRRCR